MKNTIVQSLVLSVIGLVLAFYVGYQVYRSVGTQYVTQTVQRHTVAEQTQVSGMALRREQLVEEELGNFGVATYLTPDGTKVSPGMVIAEIYRSEDDVAVLNRLRVLQSRIALLEKAQDPDTTSFAQADALNKQIFAEMGNIVTMANNGSFSGVNTTSDKILELMNTKQIATGKETDFQPTIDMLRLEYEYYQSHISHEPIQIKAPRMGYFIRGIDGYESVYNLSQLDRLNSERMTELLEVQPAMPDKQYIGKLMTDHRWYFAVMVEPEEVSRYKEGAVVTLDFHLNNTPPIDAIVYEVNQRYIPKHLEQDPGVVVFRCDFITEELVNLRNTQADVMFKQITGLRVPISALRYEGIQRGVYIMEGERVLFRPISVAYEDENFVICRENDPEFMRDGGYIGLEQFDEIIIEGI